MRVGLLELLAPQFLGGFRFSKELDDILAFLGVSEMRSAWDDSGVVLAGKALFVGEKTGSPAPVYRAPTGQIFDWADVNIQFRLTLPRTGSDFLRKAVDDAAAQGSSGSPLQDLRDTLDALEVKGASGQPSDYPGVAFRLELLLTAVTLHLPKSTFLPARIAADGWLEPDPDAEAIKLVLPKIAMIVTQGDKVGDLKVSFEAWGVQSLDDPHDLAAGELIRMVPPLCLHESRVFGFGLEKAVLDLTAEFTPPEILEQFGVGDDFTGLWLPHVRVFVAPAKTVGLAADARANDLLIGFNNPDTGNAEVSGEFALDLLHRGRRLNVEPRLFEGKRMIRVVRGPIEETTGATTVTGRASVAADGELQLAIRGGMPPYTVKVELAGAELSSQGYNGDARRPVWPLGAAGLPPTAPGDPPPVLEIDIMDSSSPPQAWKERVELLLRQAGTVIGSVTIPGAITLVEGGGTLGYRLTLAPVQPDPDAVLLRAEPNGLALLTIGSVPGPVPVGDIRVPLAPGGSETVRADWTVATGEQKAVSVRFSKAVPESFQIADEVTRVLSSQGQELIEALKRADSQPLDIEGSASYEGYFDKEPYNQGLSERRAEVLKRVLMKLAADSGLPLAFGTIKGTGTSRAKGILPGFPGCGSYPPPTGPKTPDYDADCYRVTQVLYEPAAAAAYREVTLHRAADTVEPISTPTERGPEPTAPGRPPIFQRVGFRIRLERNRLVLGEVSGELDFQTQLEASAAAIQDAKGDSGTPSVPVGPGDGVVDFRITLLYDTATQRFTEELVLGAGPDDPDGIAHLSVTSPDYLGDTLGALLTFAPLLASSIETAVEADGRSAVLPMVVAGAEIGAALALGLTGAFKTKRIILYGGRLSATQTLGSAGTFDELSVLFDYAIDFEVDVKLGPVKIVTTPGKPLRVRYRAMGVKLNFENGTRFLPVFDTSRGYEFALADPGLIQIDGPLGKILKILGARVARTNPLILELDLGLKVNLGVVTVDRVRVTLPLKPIGPPTIIPTAATVNIPGTLIGNGYVDLRNGFAGSLDLTLVAVKLRIAATVAIKHPDDQPPGRHVTAVFVGLEAEFPTALPVVNTGLGLFGLLGLFAMHYRRLEDPTAAVPALAWFDGVNGNPTDLQGWGMAVDRWSFGVGAVLGTMDGGTVLNLKGMLMLELPGPRILIFVKAKILKEKPPTRGKSEAAAILAVVDLDFALRRLTIGMLVSYEVQSLISLKVPVEAQFLFEDLSKWHLYVGRFDAPASALVLGMVRATGYLMFDGDRIDSFPAYGGPKTLPGLAVALGVRASVVLGNESAGLYLKVSAALDAGVSFSPFYIVAVLDLRGQLRLFVVSIAAWATLAVEAASPAHVEGEACGQVKLFFFKVKGCVRIHIGSKPAPLDLPALVRGMVLQSRSPALVQGQGSDRPIDASLGAAVELLPDGSLPANAQVPVVPIDAVPIFQLHAAPLQSGLSTFTRLLPQAPRLFPDGWIDQGGGRAVRYILTSLVLDPPLAASPLGAPPAVWRAPRDQARGVDTSVDLALFSWDPEPFARAFQRSPELTERVRRRWGGTCAPAAPPAPVLWTFNGRPLGSSEEGWELFGRAWPDPPGTRRSSPPETRLRVRDPEQEARDLVAAVRAAAGEGNLQAAEVIGDPPGPSASLPGRVLQIPFRHAAFADGLSIPAEYRALFDPEPQRVLLESGPVAESRLLLGLRGTLAEAGEGVLLRAYDRNGNRVEEKTLSAVPVKLIGVAADLPARWRDATGLWAAEISPVMGYLTARQPALTRVVATWVPPASSVVLEVLVLARRCVDFTVFPEGETPEEEDGFTFDVSPSAVSGDPSRARVISRGGFPRGLECGVRADLGLPQATSRVELQVSNLRPLHVEAFDARGSRVAVRDLPAGGQRPVAVVLSGLGLSRIVLTGAADSALLHGICLGGRSGGTLPPTVVVGAVELLRRAETERQVHDDAGRGAMIETLQSAMKAGRLRPLLAPDTLYKVHLAYTAEERGGSPRAVKQTLAFRTDDRPPERLDPWILATTPFHDQALHFADDPVQVWFNDASALQLFTAYGKSLRSVVRKANGAHPPSPPPITAADLKPVPASILTPFEETLRTTAGDLACLSGVVESEPHRRLDVAVPLERSTTYTLDLETDDPPPAAGDPQARLFRVAFTTSRFRSAAELAQVVRESASRHRRLRSALPLLGETPADAEIQNALLSGGLEVVPPAVQPGVTFLWQPAAGTGFALAALLLDSPEPLWRARPEPVRETVTSDNGPMEHWVKRDRLFLQVAESGTAVVSRVSRSPGGTRALVALVAGSAGRSLTLVLRQRAFDLVPGAGAVSDHLLFASPLPTAPPWRLNDV